MTSRQRQRRVSDHFLLKLYVLHPPIDLVHYEHEGLQCSAVRQSIIRRVAPMHVLFMTPVVLAVPSLIKYQAISQSREAPVVFVAPNDPTAQHGTSSAGTLLFRASYIPCITYTALRMAQP